MVILSISNQCHGLERICNRFYRDFRVIIVMSGSRQLEEDKLWQQIVELLVLVVLQITGCSVSVD